MKLKENECFVLQKIRNENFDREFSQNLEIWGSWIEWKVEIIDKKFFKISEKINLIVFISFKNWKN